TSKDNEDLSWNTSFMTKRTKKTTSALEDFIMLYLYLIGTLSLSSFTIIAKGGSSLIFTIFSLPTEAELTFEAEELLLSLVGELRMSKNRFRPSNFFSGGKGMLPTEDSSAES
nr:hypothetical protein [Tanacetum cinerariifolium]